ncbi:FixH family protein [Aneurinibacillus sp. REN35]|uniref:FixH family protein n=1 Tax=Aneurinibacillus sp. REN35 TaxID=3237286 RepID=UPI0035296446
MKKASMMMSVVLIFAMTLLSGCGQNAQPQERQKPMPIAVSLKLDPAAVNVNKAVRISVVVTQNGAPVSDAEEVKFEIGQGDKKNVQMIPAQKTEEGTYAIEHTFTASGSYYVMYHVTARGMHSMDKTDIEVRP